MGVPLPAGSSWISGSSLKRTCMKYSEVCGRVGCQAPVASLFCGAAGARGTRRLRAPACAGSPAALAAPTFRDPELPELTVEGLELEPRL